MLTPKDRRRRRAAAMLRKMASDLGRWQVDQCLHVSRRGNNRLFEAEMLMRRTARKVWDGYQEEKPMNSAHSFTEGSDYFCRECGKEPHPCLSCFQAKEMCESRDRLLAASARAERSISKPGFPAVRLSDDDWRMVLIALRTKIADDPEPM